MKGDFTRDTFHRAKHFSRVLEQQGRVALDADFNEQTAINLHNLRTTARDIIGPYAAPAGPDGGFMLAIDPKGLFTISKGRYYVDGILVENDTDNCTYKTQPDFFVSDDDALVKAMAGNPSAEEILAFWLYLDVWERHVTSIEDDSIREKALGGPDTCTRAKITWQVKAMLVTPDLQRKMAEAEQAATDQIDNLWTEKAQLEKQFEAAASITDQINILKQLQPVDDELARRTRLRLSSLYEILLSQLVRISNASLAARVDPGIKTEDACVTPPASKYRGAENQLYRVEVHRAGVAWDGSRDDKGNPAGNIDTAASFKWSRDNGSVATMWLGVEGSEIQVANARGFAPGNWVELSDDTHELLGNPGTLVQLAKVEGNALSVDPATTLPAFGDFPKHPKVRRWDYVETEAISVADDNALPIQESTDHWIDLEDGVQIQFSADGQYRTGDYWLIPARVATGTVEWPQTDDLNPQPLPPHGVEHHYAPLGFVGSLRGKRMIRNARFQFWPVFFGVEAQAGTRVRPQSPPVVPRPGGVFPTPAIPKKAAKTRKRRTEKGPASSR
jgi:Family of unknown function (DUF6519)